MPHVSKRKLEEKFVRDLFLEIVSVFERAGKRGELKEVLNQLFTHTEKIMFAKRLAVISMLSQNIPIHDIADNLSMSSSTVDIMSLKFETGSYSCVIENGLKKTNLMDIINMIQTVGGIMPARFGKGRWKSLDDSLRKERIESRLKKLIEKKKKTKKH